MLLPISLAAGCSGPVKSPQNQTIEDWLALQQIKADAASEAKSPEAKYSEAKSSEAKPPEAEPPTQPTDAAAGVSAR